MNRYNDELAGIVLAGGKGSRFGGGSKAFLELRRKPLIEFVLQVMDAITNEIIVVANCRQRYRNYQDLQVVGDVFKDAGPLGGLHAGLQASSRAVNLVVGCDMPFMHPDFLRYMVSQWCERRIEGCDILVPRLGRYLEPLCALYSRRCLPTVRASLRRGERQLHGFFSEVNVCYISEPEIERFASPNRIFMNINTPDQLRRAEQMLEDDPGC